MATKSANFRNVFETIQDIGESPSCDFDEELILSGYEQLTHKEIKLAAAAADQALSVAVAAAAILIFSHDQPFSVRLEAGGVLLTNMRKLELVGDDLDDVAYDGTATDILLTGNGANEANLEVFIIHLPV